jgi:iron-sulfur cluster assembly protein
MTLNISHRAYEKLLSMKPEGQRLRIEVAGGGCSGLSYKMSWEALAIARSGDKEMAQGPLDLVIDGRSSLFLDGVILDHSEGLQGRGFEWINPNAKRSCGCGSSFSV